VKPAPALAPMGTPLVLAEGVSFDYGGRPALRQVSFTARTGELVALVGPNGAGKSTLLKLAAGLLAPSAGQVRVGGLSPTPRPAGPWPGSARWCPRNPGRPGPSPSAKPS